MAAPWIPTEQPYRTMWIRSSSQAPGGWSTTVESYATLDEAIEAAKRPMKAGVYRVMIDRADNAATWREDGAWIRLAERGRKQPLMFTVRARFEMARDAQRGA